MVANFCRAVLRPFFRRDIIFGLLLLSSSPQEISAQPADLPDWARNETDVQRRAFVLGISEYDSLPRIGTAAVDARAVAESLEHNHFKVVARDGRQDRAEIIAAFRNFLSTIRPGDTALVYFSGHGFERNGINYVVPSGMTHIEDERLGLDAISLNYFMDEIAELRAGVALFVLDACRTDVLPPAAQVDPAGEKAATRARALVGSPAPDVTRMVRLAEFVQPGPSPVLDQANLGFNEIRSDSSRFIGYAALPREPSFSRLDTEAQDIPSFFTRNLVQGFNQPDQSLTSMWIDIEYSVLKVTSQRQRPWRAGTSYFDFFVFNQSAQLLERMRKEWFAAASLPVPLQYRALREYTKNFPDSPFAAAARTRIHDLEAAGIPMAQFREGSAS